MFRDRTKAPSVVGTTVVAFAFWIALTYVQKLVFWPLWRDQGFARAFGGRYGGDKSMTNFVVEMPAVVVLTIVAAAVSAAILRERYTRSTARMIAVGIPLLVVLLVPAFGE